MGSPVGSPLGRRKTHLSERGCSMNSLSGQHLLPITQQRNSHTTHHTWTTLLPSNFSHQSPTWPGAFLGLLSNVYSLQGWGVVVVLAKIHPHSCCSSLTCTPPTSMLPTMCAEQALHAQVLCSAHKQVFFQAWWDATFSEVGPWHLYFIYMCILGVPNPQPHVASNHSTEASIFITIHI